MDLRKLVTYFSMLVFLLSGLIFMATALVILGISIYNLVTHTTEKGDWLQELLSFVGYLIIAVAIFDVGVYLLEEQAFKERRLRTLAEARQSLTKFMVIIVIAVSLDSLLNVLKASSTDIRLLIYPAALLLVAFFLLLGLGLFLRFSGQAEKDTQNK